MKKIAFKINSLNVGGIERLIIDTTNSLIDKNYEIILIIDEKSNYIENQINNKIKVYFLDDFKNKFIKNIEKKRNEGIFFKSANEILKLFWNSYIAKKVNKILKDNKIDIFINYSGEGVKYIKKINVQKKILWNHASISGKNEKKLNRMGKRIKEYDLIVCVCDELKEEYIKYFPELKNKIIRIYNFIDEKRIDLLKEEVSDLNEEDKKLIKNKYFLSVGRLANGKGFETTITAFSILKSKGYKEKLYIIGEGNHRKELEKQIKEYGLENEIFLLGRRLNPYIWLKNSEIFIQSSFKEGFGLVTVEAMYCNIPVISSNYRCGAREILENGKYGELYNVGSEKELAEKMEKLLENKDLRKKYSEVAYKNINRFFKENCIIETDKILKLI